MSGSSQPTHSPDNPVRIVYHAGSRTFARLFNEHSLDEVKNVVRRKLGLGATTDVSLKQMGLGPLLDLEDDGDFQAFRVFIKSSVSVDIQVTVGESQGPTVPPSVTPQTSNKPTTTTSTALPSTELTGVTTSSQLSELPPTPAETSHTPRQLLPPGRWSVPRPSFTRGGTVASDKPAEERSGQPAAHLQVARNVKTPRSPTLTSSQLVSMNFTPSQIASLTPPQLAYLARKRKASPEDGNTAASDRPIEQPAPAPTVGSAVTSGKTTESLAVSKPKGTEEPPKKKLKKESTKKKEAQATNTIESPATKSLASKTKSTTKSTSSDSQSKVGEGAAKDAETSEPPAKKQKKQKKDDGTNPKKSSAPAGNDGTDQPINQPSNLVNEVPLQSATAEPRGSSAKGTTSTRKSNKAKAPSERVCDTIPQTSESICVRSEVSAAIISSYLSKATETVVPEPPAKRKSVKRVTKESAVSAGSLPRKPTTVSDAPANEILNVSAEQRPEQVALTNKPLRQRPVRSNPCPICFGEPFHIRFYCPIYMKGLDAMRKRLEELKNMGDQQLAIEQLESLLRFRVASMAPFDIPGIDGVQSGNASLPLNVPLPMTPNVPYNSYLSEVTVENRDEGSSSESSDDKSEKEVEPQELSAPQRQQSPEDQLEPSNGDLEAIIRGPTSVRQSFQDLLDRIVEDEDDENSSTDEEEAKLEEDQEKEILRLKCRALRRVTRFSVSESEEEVSRSPSPSCSVENALNNPGPGVQSFNLSAGESADRQEDVLTKQSVHPPVFERQHDGSGEETHVGSEDRMVVDELVGEKGTTIVQPSFPVPKASALQPSGDDSQESPKPQVDPTPNQDASVPAASETLMEVDADPIEPADDLTLPADLGTPNPDPIEVPSDDIRSLFSGMTQPTPKSGVSKRIKTRNGEILDDEAERPVLLEQLASETTNEVTPVVARGKSQRKAAETPASQEPTRRSPRFNSVPPSTTTPVAVALLNRGSKGGARSGQAAKTPAKKTEERSDALKSSSKNGGLQNGTSLAPAPSLIEWETLAEPSSPSLQLDEPSLLIDELISSSPQPEDALIRGHSSDRAKKGRAGKATTSSEAKSSQRQERSSDLLSSQIRCPPNTSNPTPNWGNGKITDSEEEEGLKVVKKKAKLPVRYRSLSQLASQATLFSPSFPTPANKSMTNGKAKNCATDEESSSSSSSEDEAKGSKHIPQGRRARWTKSLLPRT